MSSSALSRRLAVLGLLATAGCGFAPVYGDGGALRGLVAFDTEDTVTGFRLRERLEQRLGRPSTLRYRLQVRQADLQTAAAITAEGDTVRFNLTGDADWVLHNAQTGAVAASGRAQGFTSYSASGSTVATQTAAADARARLAVILADQIVSRLLLLSPDLTR